MRTAPGPHGASWSPPPAARRAPGSATLPSSRCGVGLWV